MTQLTVDAFPLTADLFEALAAAEERAWAALASDLIGDYEPNIDDYEYQQLLAEGRL